jgi:hypothetical protein
VNHRLLRALALSLLGAGAVSCGKKSATSSEAPALSSAELGSPTDPSLHIVLDDRHNQASGRDDALAYRISWTTALVLETRGYAIPVPEPLRPAGPSVVHVLHGEDYFRVPWDGKGSIKLSPLSLQRVKGSERFAGFEPGEKYIVAVGRERQADASHALAFDVMWTGVVEVEKR